MQTLTTGLSYVDVQFMGVPHVIATAVVHGPGGVALIDPGPSSTLPVLRRSLDAAGIRMSDVRALLLTHIHLDHAGATGTLVREQPSLRVYVHEIGLSHMAAPERLLASATRLYGDDMERLWGEFLPVPREAMVPLVGGERIDVAGRDLDVLYTPGHASHHVSYFSRDSGVAFVGDTAGLRIGEGAFVLPPTPPPDIDLEKWRQSLTAIAGWHPETLFITHFGAHAPAAPQLTELADHLDVVGNLARASLQRDETDERRAEWFSEEIRTRLRRRSDERDAQAYEVAGRFDLNWRGLARYWRKRA